MELLDVCYSRACLVHSRGKASSMLMVVQLISLIAVLNKKLHMLLI
jgi:hypothetical protein